MPEPIEITKMKENYNNREYVLKAVSKQGELLDFADESLKDDNVPEETKGKINDIITASNNLLEIVNGILDISKIEANKLELINKEYDIKSTLDELESLTRARIGEKGLELNVNIDPTLR